MKRSATVWKVIFVLVLLLPMFVLVYLLFTGGLGAQPSEEMNHKLGDFTFRLLTVNLIWGSLLALGWLPAPLRRFTYLRRHLGVVTFVYAFFHVTFYILKEGDVALAFRQIPEKLYLAVGLSAWIILLALAVTSANWAVRSLKKNWKRLHRLAYLAVALALFHFYLIEKKDWKVTLPLVVPLFALYLIRVLRALGAHPGFQAVLRRKA
jgi:sulfoxide reductase heme-binding subunit YedZ